MGRTSTELVAWRNRTFDSDSISLYESNGTTGIALASDDKVRVKIGRGNAATPDLDIDNIAATANGSVVTVSSLTAPAVISIRLGQADLSGLSPGAYDLEISVVDVSYQISSGTPAIKHCQQGVLHVVGTLAGDIGST